MEGIANSSVPAMAVKTTVVERFFVPLVPQDLMTVHLKLPHAFVKKCGQTIPAKVFWYFPNGDVFECRYCHMSKSFCGFVRVLKQYRAKTFGWLAFEYLSKSDFFVTLFDPSGVEIEYRREGMFFSYEPEISTYMSDRSSKAAVMADAINGNTLDYSCKSGWEPCIYILITDRTFSVKEKEQVLVDQNREPLSYWFDDCGVYLSTPIRVCQVHVKKEGKIRTFKEGWKEFLEETGVEAGDLLILEREGNPFHFQIAVCKGYDRVGQSFGTGSYQPIKFIRFVTESMVAHAETFVPITFWHKYGYNLEEKLTINTVDGQSFTVGYCRATNKLHGLQKLIMAYKTQNPYIMIFSYEDSTRLKLAVFGKNRIECKLE